MKVLLDECLPKKLKHKVKAELVKTVPEAGWAGKKNGELLRLAEVSFDVLLTNDQNMEYQQNLKNFDLAFVVMVAPTNDIADLLPLMPATNYTLKTIKAGEIEYIKVVSS
jgi:predicted nuclease of predicted toxin-antitoxin system